VQKSNSATTLHVQYSGYYCHMGHTFAVGEWEGSNWWQGWTKPKKVWGALI